MRKSRAPSNEVLSHLLVRSINELSRLNEVSFYHVLCKFNSRADNQANKEVNIGMRVLKNNEGSFTHPIPLKFRNLLIFNE